MELEETNMELIFLCLFTPLIVNSPGARSPWTVSSGSDVRLTTRAARVQHFSGFHFSGMNGS